MPVLVAFLIVGLLIAIGIALQWLPYGTPILKSFETKYRFAYVVLLLRDKPEYAGNTRLGNIIDLVDPGDVVDSFYVVGTPAVRTWFAQSDAKDYYNDSGNLEEPPHRTETDTRLLVFAGTVRELTALGRTNGLSLLRQISELPVDKHTTALVRWFPRLSSPAISRQEGADMFGSLLAKTI